METQLNKVGLVVVMISTIAIVNAIYYYSNLPVERVGCGATEVFRWSDWACYVPQGE
ncbi:MAG: hypothetical protein KME43_19615 [Myxacorys chilensis ATA2-1-KO14]|jgi:hypothetical protein|nr:hypothetical protein [Myxacorys chilensis ATA2-1-KO14]